jgi:hypothetical protein
MKAKTSVTLSKDLLALVVEATEAAYSGESFISSQ